MDAYVGYLTDAGLGVIFLLVGIRLHRLAQRSGQSPERILGAGFTMWGASYLVWGASWWIYEGEIGLDWLDVPCSLLAVGLSLFGDCAYALFIRVVFRRRAAWALWLVAADCAILVAGFAGSYAMGDPALELPLSNPFYYVHLFGVALPLVWMMLEGFPQYVKARKRVRLGLCSPTVCNRYLVISLASAFWIVYYALLITQYASYEQTGVGSAALNAGSVLAEIGAIALWCLAFLPPAAYRRWLESASPAEPQAQTS